MLSIRNRVFLMKIFYFALFFCGPVVLLLLTSPFLSNATAQTERPSLPVGRLGTGFQLDGLLNESDWAHAPRIDQLTMTEPIEGGELVGRTSVSVLADARNIVIGVIAYDPNPEHIVSYSKKRDPELSNEDHIKIVLDPFLDGRSGYIFAVNPGGARYDALVARQGEGESSEWDAIWEAATVRSDQGWSVELRIPIQSLTFNPELTQWGFNIERRIERLQEVSRWASPIRDAKISQTSRTGLITDLPEFSTGIGLTIRPSLVTGFEKTSPDASTDWPVDVSLDVSQRIGPNITAIGTINTDFAETEVDTRRANISRFPLFFPEKRTFFLEGSDIFDFGLGLASPFRSDIVPFFSRRIGLYEGEQVPLRAGIKLNGRVDKTNFGGLVTHTGPLDGVLDSTTMGVFRVKQNVLEESSVGMIATFGDPQGISGSYLAGADFTYQTSKLAGDKNLLVGIWGLVTDREGLDGDKTAFGAHIDYPNDTWDGHLSYKRIGDGFDPSLGFVLRRGINLIEGGVNYHVRPEWSWLRLMEYQLYPSLVLDLEGEWESYGVFVTPFNWRFESGERLEFNVEPKGEKLVEPFEIAEGVVIPPGSYHFTRYRLEADIASKRMVSGRLSWWFGDFYDGTLDELEMSLDIKPSELATFELSLVRNTGHLPFGDFTQEIVGGRIRLNFSPDLELSSFIQYDKTSREIGSNTRLRWTFHPLGNLFIVYNHNLADLHDRWERASNKLMVKLQYSFRY